MAASEAVAKVEAAATRRRWINLGEFVAVAGLLIGGASLWLHWSDRRSDLADKQAAHAAEALQAARYEIVADPNAAGDLMFVRDDRHPLGTVTLTFPTALGIGTRTDPSASAPKSWYESALLKTTDGGPDDRTGTLPVLASVQYWNDETPMTARGLYDIVWKTHGRPLLGRSLHIVGFKRRGPASSQAALDAAWAAAQAKR